MTEEEWLYWRKHGVGGSDIGSIFACDPWKSSQEVYLDKVDKMYSTNKTESLNIGIRLKDFIANEFTKSTSFKTRRRNAILQHPEHYFMIGNIDRWIPNHNAGLLCKNISQYSADKWKNGKVPRKYLLQVMHYMAVTEASCWYIALLIGGGDFSVTKVNRDEKLIKEIEEKVKNFWYNYVLTQQPPPYDGSLATKKYLTNVYSVAKPRSIVKLPKEASTYIKQYKKSLKEEDKIKMKRYEAENKIKELMGDNEIGEIGEYKVEWKNVKKPSDSSTHYRRFQIK